MIHPEVESGKSNIVKLNLCAYETRAYKMCRPLPSGAQGQGDWEGSVSEGVSSYRATVIKLVHYALSRPSLQPGANELTGLALRLRISAIGPPRPPPPRRYPRY